MSSDLRPPFRPIRPPQPSSAGRAKVSSLTSDSKSETQDPKASSDAVQPVVSSTATSEKEDSGETERAYLEPIPPPGEEMQYRAIGLIEGRYIPSPEQFTRGILRTPDGLDLDAVLLGRVMSLVRKHLEPERNYLWVVYPRTREKTVRGSGTESVDLHVQLMGVWAPEEMGQPLPEGSRSPVVPDWFSIRGEVVFQSQEKGFIIVKILQAGKKTSANRSRQRAVGHNEAALANKPQAFKLRLIGSLPSKGVGNFWDLQVRRQGSLLYVEAGTPVGPVIKTPPRPRLKRSTPRPQIKKNSTHRVSGSESLSPRGEQSIPEQFYSPRDPAKVPKPIKKKRS